jgi:hypothetical protein
MRRTRILMVVVIAAAATFAARSPHAGFAASSGRGSDVQAFAAYCQRLSSATAGTPGPYEATLTDLKARSSCTFQLDDPWRLAAVPDEVAQLGTANGRAQQGYRSVIYDTAAKYQIPPAYLSAVMMAESRGDAFAVGDRGHSLGLFQLHDQGLGQSLGDRRLDPVLSAQIAAAALSEGWREGLKRNLSGDDLIGFAYGYKFNPGGDRHESGTTVRAIYRRFTGGPSVAGDPNVDFSGILQDAAVFGGSGSDYFVTLFRPQDMPYSGPRSLAEVGSKGPGEGAVDRGLPAQDRGSPSPFGAIFALGPAQTAVALLLLLAVAAAAYRIRPAVAGAPSSARSNGTISGGVLHMAMFKRKSSDRPAETSAGYVSQPSSPQQASTPAGAPSLAAPPMPETASVRGSERIRIIEDQIRDQRALMAQAEQEFDQETTGLKVYLQRQGATLDTILNQLEQRLRPLREYVAREESNLNGLIEDMTRRPEDFVAENFAGYISTQKANIDLTRTSIEQQRNPFIDYFEQQMEALELSLKQFDPFIERLAANLDEQQEILEGFLGAMRDDHFQAVRSYLDERSEAWVTFAAAGETDPTDTYRRLRQLRDSFARLSQGQQHMGDLLTQTTQADDHLGDLVRPQGRTDPPIPIREDARPGAVEPQAVAAGEPEA